MLSIYKFKIKYLFLVISLIFSMFLESTPESLNFFYILYIILFLIFFFDSIKSFFKELINKKKNLEKLILLIIILSVFSLIINLYGYNNITLNQIFRDYIFFSYLFIPYLFINLKSTYKDFKFLLISFILMGYIIYFKIVIRHFLIANDHKFLMRDFTYIHLDTSILFSLNFLLLYFFSKKNYLVFYLFLFQYIYYCYFMRFSGTDIPILNFFLIIFLIIFNYVAKKFSFFNFRLKPNYIYIFTMLFFAITIDMSQVIADKFLNNRLLEFQFFKNFLAKSSIEIILFGSSLGNLFNLDYIANVKISYLHNFFLYIILKLGFLGIFLLTIYFILISNFDKINSNNIISFFEIKQKNLIFLSSLLLIILGFTFTTFYKTINFWILIGLLLKQNSYHIQR